MLYSMLIQLEVVLGQPIPEPPALLSAGLFGSATVPIPLQSHCREFRSDIGVRVLPPYHPSEKTDFDDYCFPMDDRLGR